MMDMHVHLLPGVDDGAADAQMTREMARRAADAGITHIVATPHVYRAQAHAASRTGLDETQDALRALGMGLSLGCELSYRALAGAGGQALDALCLGDTRCILLELPGRTLIPRWEAVLSALCDHGYLPIIAHPERYAYVQRDFGVAAAMCNLGCELQVDACGLMAPVMSAERRTARRLVKEGMAAYIASDAHRPGDYDAYARAYRAFRGEWPAQNRLTDALLLKKGACC